VTRQQGICWSEVTASKADSGRAAVRMIFARPSRRGTPAWRRQMPELSAGRLARGCQAAGGTVLTYGPANQTLRADGHDAPSVVIGKDATNTRARQNKERRTA
jgi:hypothetical protein